MTDIHSFIIVENLFERYTVIVQLGSQTTSVYCDECEQWVTQWQGEQLSRNTELELYEMILKEHKQDFGKVVTIFNQSINLYKE